MWIVKQKIENERIFLNKILSYLSLLIPVTYLPYVPLRLLYIKEQYTPVAACSIMIREVSTLNHELWDDPVKRWSGVPEPLLPGAQRTEVFGRFGDNIWSEFDDDLAERLTVSAQGHGTHVTFLG